MRKLFYGRIAVGKSSVARIISKEEGVEFIDCDKEIWKHFSGDEQKIRNSVREAIENGDKEKYKEEIIEFSKQVDWENLFSKDANYEVSVLGNFFNIKAIPEEIVNRFKVYKVMCYIETRTQNIKDRNLNTKWVEKLDYMFEDPSGVEVAIIFNEDILGERNTPDSKKIKMGI